MIVGGSMPISPRCADSSTAPTPNQPAEADSVVTSCASTPSGKRGDEEAGVVAPHLALRRHPPRPRMHRRAVDGEPVGAQQLAERDPAGLDVRPRGRQVGDRHGEQHPGLFEHLAHRGADDGTRLLRCAVEPLRGAPAGAVGEGQVGVGGVDPSAWEHRHARRERHPGDPGHQPDLELVHAVAQQHDCGRVADLRVGHRTSTISSTSTGASRGSAATPTAERACG